MRPARGATAQLMGAPNIFLGTAHFGMPYGVTNRSAPIDGAGIDRLLDAALDLGVTGLDTAAAYGMSEEHIGKALQKRPALRELKICTKATKLDPDLPAGRVAHHLRQAVEGSCRRLRVERLDWLLLHHADDVRNFGDAVTDTLDACQHDGVLGGYGVSVYEVDEMERTTQHGAVSAVQFPFNALDRRFAEQDVSWPAGVIRFARSALLQGALAVEAAMLPAFMRHLVPWRKTLEQVGRANGMTSLAETAVRFAASASGAHALVIGADTVPQLEQTCTWARAAIPKGFTQAVRASVGTPAFADVDPRRWPAA